jgi:protein gp37
MAITKIEWAEKVWNPVTGCTPVSEGCQNCYAKRMTNRLKGRYGYPKDDPFRVTFHLDRLDEPLRWKKPSRIFVCSMGDLFHWKVSLEWQAKILNTIYKAEWHQYLILTKRPEQMDHFQYCCGGLDAQNIWLGVSIENQKTYDERAPILSRIECAHRFISFEPLLGPIISEFLDWRCDWCIVGAETGPKARPMDLQWARDLRDQCKAAGVPFFFKKASPGQVTPKDLMVRESPK